MNKQDQSIYQSGQNVLINGLYEVVAVKINAVSQFTTGERFPDYDGRAVCWHLLKSQAGPEKSEERATKFEKTDTFYGGMYS